VGRHAKSADHYRQATPLKISVSLSYNIFEPLTYQTSAAAESGLKVGMRVLVPLGNRIVSGWVLNLDSPYKGRLKNIIGVIDDPFCPDEAFLEFARQSAAAYFASVGVVLDHALPGSIKNLQNLYLELDGQVKKFSACSWGQLEKMAAATALRFYFKKKNIEQVAVATATGSSSIQQNRLLLDSGRGHDYKEISQAVLASGKSVILLVPDNASARYWQTIWPDLDIYNSETRPAAKEKIWAQYQQGKSGIVCGGLAAILLPLTNLGLLIVDRAASPLYQRTFRSPFKTDHLARIRAQANRIPLLQGAAAHSCSTYRQRENLAITDRRHDRGISSQVHILKGKDRGIPTAVIELISQFFLQKKKTLILVNKIHPALNLFCAKCGKIVSCPGCGGILQVDESQQAACRRCSFRQELLTACPRCQKNLTLLHDISLDSLAKAIERNVGEKSVLTLSAAELKNMEQVLPAITSSAIVIATAAALNPFFKEIFAAVIYIKPESFFSMDEFNSAEMIYSTAAEIMETLISGGELHVFSVFHFHYALQFLLDEDKFFERELKYRQWFLLPPFSNVYQLEIRNNTLRSLAGAMRDLYAKYKTELQIKKIYLASRLPLRGTYRGVLELHAPAVKIIQAGLPHIKKSSLTLLAE
jgi:primosomal protein N'